ncbi:hypothetical protein [Bradyrhizobium sacchari]|uniref:Uncharacterized protein n=1 Tax=Bradyrhizobium sacchari TaxID=1399419 RepID=A0A560JC83_9BRAD|nr:hypothetical protein [Bradyrhizobium sacchari]TWB49696.1 hypothetical protein FBZ94_1129 [Bradyrhizobium sacchari]TWB68646.1 hypothetical protein FBZ95_111204 [Bradyrhizobium sacchari]
MILLRDFLLFVLPGLVAAGGWRYAFSLRRRARPDRAREGTRPGGTSGAEKFSAP